MFERLSAPKRIIADVAERAAARFEDRMRRGSKGDVRIRIEDEFVSAYGRQISLMSESGQVVTREMYDILIPRYEDMVSMIARVELAYCLLESITPDYARWWSSQVLERQCEATFMRAEGVLRPVGGWVDPVCTAVMVLMRTQSPQMFERALAARGAAAANVTLLEGGAIVDLRVEGAADLAFRIQLPTKTELADLLEYRPLVVRVRPAASQWQHQQPAPEVRVQVAGGKATIARVPGVEDSSQLLIGSSGLCTRAFARAFGDFPNLTRFLQLSSMRYWKFEALGYLSALLIRVRRHEMAHGRNGYDPLILGAAHFLNNAKPNLGFSILEGASSPLTDLADVSKIEFEDDVPMKEEPEKWN